VRKSFVRDLSLVQTDAFHLDLVHRSLKRIISPNLFKTVPFSDVILADILTSSAKVLGDVWLAACYLMTPSGVKEEAAKSSCGRIWGVPLMVA